MSYIFKLYDDEKSDPWLCGFDLPRVKMGRLNIARGPYCLFGVRTGGWWESGMRFRYLAVLLFCFEFHFSWKTCKRFS